MSGSVRIIGPRLEARPRCEGILRSLPRWFGIEHALVMYADDTLRLPTFAAVKDEEIVAFISLRKHFEHAWEIHCIAVDARFRNHGHGRALVAHAESWLTMQGVTWLQVKTVAATSASVAYAETREFYARLGFQPLEVFPELWTPNNPALQLVKVLPARPDLTEPLVACRVQVPAALQSQVASLAISLGGHVDEVEEGVPLQTLHVRIPEEEVAGFELWLASISKGEGRLLE